MSIPAGIGDAGALLGVAVIPGIGAIVDAGTAEVFGAGVLTGAGVLIGMPGMGAIVGSAAITGVAHASRSNAIATTRRTENGAGFVEVSGILRTVVHRTRTGGFTPSSQPSTVVRQQIRQVVSECGVAQRQCDREAGYGQRRDPYEPAVFGSPSSGFEAQPGFGA